MSSFYKVEKILEKKVTNEGVKYRIKWLGFSEKESTWEPLDNLTNVVSLINKFEVESNTEKPKEKKKEKLEKKEKKSDKSNSPNEKPSEVIDLDQM